MCRAAKLIKIIIKNCKTFTDFTKNLKMEGICSTILELSLMCYRFNIILHNLIELLRDHETKALEDTHCMSYSNTKAE